MSAEQLRAGAKIAAVHEAAHAVVAEHLGLRVERVKLSRYWADPLSIFQQPEPDLSGGDVSYEPSESALLTEYAIISAAARVAVDAPISPGVHPEAAYSHDEECLTALAGKLHISDFPAWRLGILERAREVVSLEFVRAAILRIAQELQAAPLEDGLTGEHVREILRACKTKTQS